MAKHRYVPPFEFASVRFALGQTDLGFRDLAQACDDRAFDVLALQLDPRLEPLERTSGSTPSCGRRDSPEGR